MKKIGLSGSKNLFQNIQRLDHAYGKVLAEIHMIPVVIPIMDNPDCAKTILEGLDGLILTGGTDIWTFAFNQDPIKETEYLILKQRSLGKKPLFRCEDGIAIFRVVMSTVNQYIARGTLIQR